MNQEEHDELWDLLGKSRPASVSPLFSRNVLREVRALKQEPSGTAAWLLFRFRCWLPQHWRLVAVSSCAACLTVVMLAGERNPDEHQQIVAMAERVSASPDYQVINHLDELLDSEKNSVWLDNGASVY